MTHLPRHPLRIASPVSYHYFLLCPSPSMAYNLHPPSHPGFTSMSKEVAPQMVMEFLNELFSKFDEICDKYNVYKVGE